jgi:hypothetical protein
MKYIYVLSHVFSGSTLLAFLLGSHPKIATVGESSITRGIDLDRYPCSCGRLIHECPFWAGVHRRMAAQGMEYDFASPRLRFRVPDHEVADRLVRAGPRGPLLESIRSLGLIVVPGARRELDELLRRNEVFARTVVELLGGDCYLDVSKHPNRLFHLEKIRGLDIRVIHLIRDARAVSHSARKNVELPVEEGARSWQHSAEACALLKRDFDEARWTTLRLEDLCADPDATMARLHDFAEVGRDDAYKNFRDSVHHIIGNRMRLGSSSEIRLDERWRQALTPAELERIDRIAGRTNRAFGYGR